jgi:hypothetical protein
VVLRYEVIGRSRIAGFDLRQDASTLDMAGDSATTEIRADYSVDHCHTERPHQSLGNELLNQAKKRGRSQTKWGNVEDEFLPLTQLKCKQRLGGLLKSYSRRAA